MHSHLQDLQEANEAAAARLEQADKIIATLRNENNALHSQSETSLEELHTQNFLLKEQVRSCIRNQFQNDNLHFRK